MAGYNELRDNGDGTYSLLVEITDSGHVQQVDLRGRKHQLVQTHTSVSIAASGTNINSTYLDLDGFSEIGITVVNDAATNNAVPLYWSNDGVNIHGHETALASGAPGANFTRAGLVPIKARYLKVGITNADTGAAHVMSAWVYLKV